MAKKVAVVLNKLDDETELKHYGTKRHSGRYPWGSGKDPYQHSADFIARVNELKAKGMRESEIANAIGLTTTQLRVQKALAKGEQRAIEVDRAKKLREKGYSLQKVAEMMGYENDSSIRSLLNEKSEERMLASKKTADFLKEQVDKKGMIDVGKGVERELGISNEKMKEALYILEREGYEVYGGGVAQVTNPGKQTNMKILCPPGTEHKEIYNLENIHTIKDYHSDDGGETFRGLEYPASLDSKRIKIRYAEEGGTDRDGLIEIRRGCEDLSMGDSKYCQVRIMVDGTHYLKGMAVYSDDLPKGCDVRFNTNKHVGTEIHDVLKPIKSDPDNPFGALIKPDGQNHYIGKDGKEHLGLINKKSDEGDWQRWADKVPSQFLAKQNIALIKKQLGLTMADKDNEFAEICALTNPTVKKRLLQSFADDCDSAAVHLKTASLPRQKYHVILPCPSLKDNEVYAPKYKDGETIALVRFPHGGTFEIPILKVNNKNKEAIKMIGKDAIDAVCINSKNAERLSGADFDGDTVMTVPTGGKIKITSTPPLQGLVGFDAKDISQYGTVKKEDGKYYNKYGKPIKVMKNTQTEMGIISNLITDMTLKGAKPEELARAVKHSMVVIDAEKHKLDYKTSYLENNIEALKKKYQGHEGLDGKHHEGGASTLISRAKAEYQVLKRKGTPHIDPKTGDLIYKEVREEYTDKKGKVQVRTQKSTQMAEVKDAHVLSTGHPKEEAYAEYANHMKQLARDARKILAQNPKLAYSASAKVTYAKEAKSLDDKLNLALLNAPKERRAQTLANAKVNQLKKEYPDMTKEEIKKASQRALAEARIKVGAHRVTVEITDNEWTAIQAGAISDTKLAQILNHTDIDKVKERATPRATQALTEAKVNKISAMKNSGYTIAQIAEAIGCSASTVSKYLNQ